MRWQSDVLELVGEFEGERCAIVGTGPSLEETIYDVRRELGAGTLVIGLNEAAKAVGVPITVMCDARAVPKATRFVRPFSRMVLSASCAKALESSYMDDLRPCVTVHEVVMSAQRSNVRPSQALFCRSGVLSAALSLAELMGAREAHLYGCDFYRLRERAYAWDIAPPKEESLDEIGGGRFTTPALRAMAAAVQEDRAKGMWRRIERIKVHGEHSQIAGIR